MATNIVSHDLSNAQQRDEFGRDAAERTIELSPLVAEAVNTVVEDGQVAAIYQRLLNEYEAASADTFDDALSYIVYRGIAEIKRQQDSAAKMAEERQAKKDRTALAAVLEVKPDLLNDPAFQAKLLAALRGAHKK